MNKKLELDLIIPANGGFVIEELNSDDSGD